MKINDFKETDNNNYNTFGLFNLLMRNDIDNKIDRTDNIYLNFDNIDKDLNR